MKLPQPYFFPQLKFEHADNLQQNRFFDADQSLIY